MRLSGELRLRIEMQPRETVWSLWLPDAFKGLGHAFAKPPCHYPLVTSSSRHPLVVLLWHSLVVLLSDLPSCRTAMADLARS